VTDLTGARRSARRPTRQRTVVAELLTTSPDFLSAQEIHAALRARGEPIGLATVYRNLALMVELGEVDTVVLDYGQTLYRQCSDRHHHHLVCRRCGRTVEIAGPAVEAWAADVAAEQGFTDLTHRLELLGLCAECRS
jgi:Fur family transcriptional regulator, ferric uptake regulator